MTSKAAFEHAQAMAEASNQQMEIGRLEGMLAMLTTAVTNDDNASPETKVMATQAANFLKERGLG